MKPATLKQAGKVLKLVEDLPVEHLQDLLESGLLSILLKANVPDMMNRMSLNDFRKLCGLTGFPIWKTIKIGTGLKTDNDFCQALNNEGFKISGLVKHMFKNSGFTVVAEETELDLVKITAKELGFKDGGKRNQIFVRAKEFGLELCFSEVGPQLRLQYRDQPNCEWALIAMEPIALADGTLKVFHVERNGDGLWLYSSDGDADHHWSSDSLWVFVLPHK